jgi:hypothetical protein
VAGTPHGHLPQTCWIGETRPVSQRRRNERWHTLADSAGHPFDLCLNPDDPRTTLMSVMLDCPDAKALSHFYAELLGKPVTYEADGVAMIGEDRAQPVMFQQVEAQLPKSICSGVKLSAR